MVSSYPHMVSAGRRNTPLNNIVRGSNPNYNLRSRGAKRQRNGEDRSD